jgi:hypothetical protein
MASRALQPHQHLDRILRGAHPPTRYHWHHVLGAMEWVCADQSDVHVKLLRRVATFEGSLRLNPSHGLSHALPPEEMLRLIAVQTLRGWHRTRHRDVIRQAAERTEHDLVALVAREALTD